MAQILLARGLLSRFRSDRPASCELIQKTVQERRKDGGQDQSQDPDGFGVCLWLTGKYYEAGKSDNTRHSTHSKSNKHADDHLLHGISSFILRASKRPAPPDLRHTDLDLSTKCKTCFPSTLFRDWMPV